MRDGMTAGEALRQFLDDLPPDRRHVIEVTFDNDDALWIDGEPWEPDQ